MGDRAYVGVQCAVTDAERIGRILGWDEPEDYQVSGHECWCGYSEVNWGGDTDRDELVHYGIAYIIEQSQGDNYLPETEVLCRNEHVLIVHTDSCALIPFEKMSDLDYLASVKDQVQLLLRLRKAAKQEFRWRDLVEWGAIPLYRGG